MNQELVLKNIAKKVSDLAANVCDTSIKAESDLLYSRLSDPQTYITFIGETSSGKSTLINGILKRQLLKTAARPSTATVTQIQCSEVKEIEFFAINQDATLERIDRAQFEKLSLAPDQTLLRLFVDIPITNDSFMGINIFDTPGFNSIIAEHEEVLREFIPQSDVVVFVVNYRVGFGLHDQELMNLVGKIQEKDRHLPVFMIINRCQKGLSLEEKRVKEIVCHASDSLHLPVKTFLVDAVVTPKVENEIFPEVGHVWEAIYNHASSEDRISDIQKKNCQVLQIIISEIERECKNRLHAMNLDSSALDVLQNEREDLKEKLKESFGVVDKFMGRIQRVLPSLLEKNCLTLKENLKAEILDSNKWTEANLCASYIASHVVPFGIRRITHSAEKYIEETFEEMDQELSEMANKAIEKIQTGANKVDKPEMSGLLINIGENLAIQAAKNGMNIFLKNLGGIGGNAAGAGNLIKMLLSKGGKVIGKKFSRDVYSTIGKIFNKGFMKKLNIAILMLSEVFTWVWEAKHWQMKLVKKVDESIDAWFNECCSDLENEMLLTYAESNKKHLAEIYKIFDEVIEREIGYINQKLTIAQEAELKGYIAILKGYKNELEAIEWTKTV